MFRKCQFVVLPACFGSVNLLFYLHVWEVSICCFTCMFWKCQFVVLPACFGSVNLLFYLHVSEVSICCFTCMFRMCKFVVLPACFGSVNLLFYLHVSEVSPCCFTCMFRKCHLVVCRFRFVCHAVIGEKQGQDVRVCSRCLLDPDRDNFSTAFYENAHLFAVGTVYAMYQE